jgi:hypothetical protein
VSTAIKRFIFCAIIIMMTFRVLDGATPQTFGGILSPSFASPSPKAIHVSMLLNSQKLFLHPMPPVFGAPLLSFPGIPVSIIVEQNLSASDSNAALVYSLEIALNSDNAPTTSTALEWVVGDDAILFKTSFGAVSSMETNAWRLRFISGVSEAGWCAYGGIEGALILDLPDPFMHIAGFLSISGPVVDELIQWSMQGRMSCSGRREVCASLGITVENLYAEAGWCLSSEGSHAALIACLRLDDSKHIK